MIRLNTGLSSRTPFYSTSQFTRVVIIGGVYNIFVLSNSIPIVKGIPNPSQRLVHILIKSNIMKRDMSFGW